MSDLKLEVGKNYITREGDIATVSEGYGSDPATRHFSVTHKNPQAHRRHYLDGTSMLSTRYDLVAPWGDEALRIREDIRADMVDLSLRGPEINPVCGRKQTLETAMDCVTRDRNVQYGDPEDSFAEIAKRWSLHLGCEVKPHDVPLMLIDLKLVRLKTSPQKADNWIDIAGYAACGSETAKAKV